MAAVAVVAVEVVAQALQRGLDTLPVAAVAVVAVEVVAQALQRGLDTLPVAAAAGRLPTGLGAQQPVGVDRCSLTGRRHGPPPSEVAAAAALRLPAGPAGLLAGEPVAGAAARPSRASLPPRCFASPG